MRSTVAAGLAFCVLLASACFRGKPEAAPSPEVEKELKALQGEWLFVEQEREEKISKIPEEGQDILTIKGTEYTELMKPLGTMFTGTIVVDPTHKPKTMVVHLSNATPGEKVTKIYEFAGDTLRMDTVYQGNKIPAEISSKEPGRTVKIYTRKK